MGPKLEENKNNSLEAFFWQTELDSIGTDIMRQNINYSITLERKVCKGRG